MKLRSSKAVFLLWLICCHLAITPIVASHFWNNEKEAPEGLSDDLKTLKSYARKVSRERENLESFYKEWLLATADTLESLNRTRDEIIQVTKQDNCITLAASVAVVTVGVTALMSGGLSMFVVAVPSFGLGAIGVQLFSGTSRYLISKMTCNVASLSVNTSRRYTTRLSQKMYSYFDAVARFKEFGNGMRGCGSRSLVLNKIAESEGFFQDLDIDKKTERDLRNLLFQMIRTDESEIKPHIWVVDAAKSFVEEVWSSVSDAISVRGNEKESNVPPLDHYIQLPEQLSLGALFDVLRDTNSLDLKEAIQKLIEIENVVSVLLSALIITGEVAVGARAAINLAEGSISVESEEILKAMENLAGLRREVVEKVKENFGW